MLILGVDEAGRGPVIGPLVMCGVLIEESKLKYLEKMGVKDSKNLTSKKRDELFDKIKKYIKQYKLVIIEPSEIDFAVESESSNLNQLEAEKTVEILNELKPEKAFIDCPDVNILNYKNSLNKKLKECCNKEINLIVEHKAEKYFAVAAASILAKVTRDRLITEIKSKFNIDFGSGYSSDKYTQKFMELNWNNREYNSFIRKSWATYKRLKFNNNQSKLDNY